MRYYLNNNYFFITCRTFNKDKFFLHDYQKQVALDKILETAEFFKIKYDAYSILSNHYHLLFYLKEGLLLKKIIQKINGGISYELNEMEKIRISRWDKYHNANVFNKEAYLNILGYILGNPFKHGLVKSIDELAEYPFCNYRQRVERFGKENTDEIIRRVKNLNWEINC